MTSRARWRAVLLNAGLVLLSTTLSLFLLAAVLLHLPEPEPVPAEFPDYGELIAYDPDRPGGHLRPSMDLMVQGERAGQAVRWRTDRHGFRIDHDLLAKPAPDVERIFLVGDSYIDGMRTDQDATIGARLQAHWASAGHASEVVIVGHNNPANAWYWLQEHSAAFEPERVILGITLGNDIVFQNLFGGGLVSGSRPGEVMLVNREFLDGDPWRLPGQLPADAFAPECWLADAWNAREFDLRRRLSTRLDAFADAVPPLVGPFPTAPRQFPDRDFFTSLNLYLVPATVFTAEAYQRFDEVLAGIAALLRERGVAFEVVLLPTRFQVDERDWRLLKRAYALDGQRFDLRAPNRRILATCAAEDIRCLDPTDAMQAHIRATGERLYRPRGDMHFSEAGNAFLAAWLAERLPSSRRARSASSETTATSRASRDRLPACASSCRLRPSPTSRSAISSSSCSRICWAAGR